MKLTKAIAGYHMLMILSEIDNNIHKEEGKVILRFLAENFPHNGNIEKQNEQLSAIPKEDYILHFNKCMEAFYQDSTDEERAHFLDFAVKMVKADNIITREENVYLNELFNAWDVLAE
jgi:hypothetical protein